MEEDEDPCGQVMSVPVFSVAFETGTPDSIENMEKEITV